jgi:hypothetical protein
MESLGRRGRFWLLRALEPVPAWGLEPLAAFGAVDHNHGEVVTLVAHPAAPVPARGRWLSDVVVEAGARLERVDAGGTADARDRFVVVPWSGGVSLSALLAQGAAQGGALDVEVAVALVLAAARGVAAVRGAGVEGPLWPVGDRLHVGFDGRAALWAFFGPPMDEEADPDDFEDRIGIFPGVGALYDQGPIGVITPSWVMHRAIPRADDTAAEEARHEPRDARSDVFVLGALAWLALTGASPFERANLLSSLDALRAADLPSLWRTIPAPLERLLRSTLAGDPDRRPANPATLAQMLALFVDEEDARQSVAAVARSLFPLAARDADDFAEQARMWMPDTPAPSTTTTMLQTVVSRTQQQRSSTATAMATPVRVPGLPLRASPSLVRNGDVVAWQISTGVTVVDRRASAPTLPALGLSPADAFSVARFLGGRLPTDDEWSVLADGGRVDVPSRCGVEELCRCWEWTSTPHRDGYLVRGGAWRNREWAPIVDNRSWEDTASDDVGFRIVFDD